MQKCSLVFALLIVILFCGCANEVEVPKSALPETAVVSGSAGNADTNPNSIHYT